MKTDGDMMSLLLVQNAKLKMEGLSFKCSMKQACAAEKRNLHVRKENHTHVASTFGRLLGVSEACKWGLGTS